MTNQNYLSVGDIRQSAFEFDYSNISNSLTMWWRFKLFIGCSIAMPFGIALSVLLGKRIRFASTYTEHGKIVKCTIMEIIQ